MALNKAYKFVPIFAALFAAGLAGEAQAVPQAYALSYDNIYNGQILFSNPAAVSCLGVSPGVCAQAPNTQASATLNGSGPATSAPLDALPAVAGTPPGPVVNNAFKAFGQAGSVGFNYGWGDAHIISEQTTAPCSGATCFHAVNEGESSVTGGNSATGNGLVGSTTGFTLAFTVLGGTENIDISLNAYPYAQVFLDPSALGAPGDQAGASLKAVATIVNTTTGLTVFTFAPNGSGAGPVLGGLALSDPFTLNHTFGSTLPGGLGNAIYNPCGGPVPTGETAAACGMSNFFEVVALGLTAGNYELRLSAEEDTNVERRLPEPGSIALLGLGLAAMGLFWLKRR